MKNKKIFIGVIGVVIILCSLFFLFGSNSKDIEICHNLSWKDNADKVEEKLSKLDLVSCEDSSKMEIDNQNLTKEPYFVTLDEEGISSKSSSINLGDIPLTRYVVVSAHNANEEIVVTDEVFLVSDEYSEEFSYDDDYKLLYNMIIEKIEKKGAEKVSNFVTYEKNDVLIDVYKTKNNYITITRTEDASSSMASVGIHCFNPKYSEEDVISYHKDAFNSRIFNEIG